MSIQDVLNKPDIPSLWRDFISTRDSMQLARDKVLQVIDRLKGADDYQSIASAEEKRLVDETESILRGTIK